MKKFEGTENYVATEDLRMAVNAGHHAGAPAAHQGRARHRQDRCWPIEVAKALGAPLIAVAHQVDHQGAAGPRTNTTRSRRLRDSQLGDERVQDIHNYIKSAASCGRRSTRRRAPGAADRRDRQGRHRVPQRPAAASSIAWSSSSTRRARPIKARHRPIVVITSNNEKELPDAFLRRCFFHYIRFPDRRHR